MAKRGIPKVLQDTTNGNAVNHPVELAPPSVPTIRKYYTMEVPETENNPYAKQKAFDIPTCRGSTAGKNSISSACC